MSVWLTIPSKRPPEQAEQVLKLWRERGYKIALLCDAGDPTPTGDGDHVFSGPYPGYAKAVNFLIGWLMANEPNAEWFIAAGDDIEPDAHHSAEDIRAQCRAHFNTGYVKNIPTRTIFNEQGEPVRTEFVSIDTVDGLSTFGVMQPTGDRYGENEIHMGRVGSAYIDRVCGSAWIGREFARRAYRGTSGPLWPEYFHMGCDEELQAVAEKFGVLWQRPDLTHKHNHWARKRGAREDMPAFLERANSGEEWRKYKELFAARKAAGFPGSEVL